MKRLVRRAGAFAAAIALLAVGQASAQTAPPVRAQAEAAQSGTDVRNKWYLGVLSGIQVVDHGAALAGVEFGVRVRNNLQFMVEGGQLRDVVTSSRVAEVNAFASYLQGAEGLPASGTIDTPAWFGMAGLRYVYENSSGVRPYAFANAGFAKVEYRPTFLLNGVNVTTALSQLGVTLGRDLLGPGRHFAWGGGAGLVFGDKWYLDLGVRLMRIQSPDHPTDVRRVSIGMGRRF